MNIIRNVYKEILLNTEGFVKRKGLYKAYFIYAFGKQGAKE
jgi:hypothetical protein